MRFVDAFGGFTCKTSVMQESGGRAADPLYFSGERRRLRSEIPGEMTLVLQLFDHEDQSQIQKAE